MNEQNNKLINLQPLTTLDVRFDSKNQTRELHLPPLPLPSPNEIERRGADRDRKIE